MAPVARPTIPPPRSPSSDVGAAFGPDDRRGARFTLMIGVAATNRHGSVKIEVKVGRRTGEATVSVQTDGHGMHVSVRVAKARAA